MEVEAVEGIMGGDEDEGQLPGGIQQQRLRIRKDYNSRTIRQGMSSQRIQYRRVQVVKPEQMRLLRLRSSHELFWHLSNLLPLTVLLPLLMLPGLS
jgi:hypothetical protein